jgi:hypothetical protein
VRDEEALATLTDQGDGGETGEPLLPLGGLQQLRNDVEQDWDNGLATKRKSQAVETLRTDAVVARVNFVVIVVLQDKKKRKI